MYLNDQCHRTFFDEILLKADYFTWRVVVVNRDETGLGICDVMDTSNLQVKAQRSGGKLK